MALLTAAAPAPLHPRSVAASLYGAMQQLRAAAGGPPPPEARLLLAALLPHCAALSAMPRDTAAQAMRPPPPLRGEGSRP
eukprot:gene7883-168_t